MDKTPRGLLAAAFAALLLGGCAYQPGPVERLPDDPGALLEQARQQEPERAAISRLEAADILARQGQRTQALAIAAELDDRRLPDDQRLRWAMLLSELGEAEGDPSAVIQAGQLLGEIDLPRDAGLILRERQGKALAEIGEHRAAAESLMRVQSHTDRDVLNETIWASLTRLERSELDAMRDGADELTLGWLTLAGLVRDSGGDVQRLSERLETWRERNVRHPAARRVPSDLAALRELRGQQVQHIAVFLPESGPLASVAEAIRDGMRAHHQATAERNGGVRLTFLDASHGNLDMLYEEARSRGAQVVIGPLDKDQITELENRDQVPLPTLGLNYGHGETNRARGLFQYGLSAEDEARQVARRGREDGHRRSALLIPDNEWGNRVGRAFEREWRRLDGTVTNVVAYNPGGSATESTRRALAGGRPDMLFLLALPSYARQVPPTLEYYDAAGLPIYATSHLFEGRPQPLLDHDLDAVNFLDIPWQIPDAAVGGVEALPYADSYRQLRSDADPSVFRLMAMGVDAYELARRLPQFQLMPDSQLFGATGTLVPAADGRIQRHLPWARFERGVPQPILTIDLFGSDPLGNGGAHLPNGELIEDGRLDAPVD
ncbi:ABC transporter substrate-binding protein [Halomonas campisalis]|uniref:ABC transporter substrate-binding protein n=1 Tax=Billgrantia campisalis TaxID=74661 RepID=A0ABS9P5A6_9GAMM|nr:penicillin-binding protein activator [Halomonas campisalis]MCG6656437.1 ABC transporter substrate-binding protein [Halomonas campisalis]MDR5861623.1 penicillin-binding protein activator [Halomonas campisalis]